MKRNKMAGAVNGIEGMTQLRADFLMLIVTMLWGSSYLFMSLGLETFQTFNLVALRFGLAFLLAGLVFYRRVLRADFKTIFYGFVLGSILFLLMSVVTIGLTYTTISNAGFLFSLSVVFVPLLLAIFFRKKPERKVAFGVCIAFIGIALLTLNHTLTVNTGDFLIILGAFCYATLIIVTDKLTKNVDSITLGIFQLGFAGAWGLIFSFVFETPHLPNTTESWVAILCLSILCSAIGFIGQAYAQKYTTPTHTGLIFSLEPVFAALFAFLFVNETLSAKGYVGAILILIGVLAAEIDFKKFSIKKLFGKTVNSPEA